MIVDPYPNDPWKSPEYWPNEFGQLTNVRTKCFSPFNIIKLIIITNNRLENNNIMNWENG